LAQHAPELTLGHIFGQKMKEMLAAARAAFREAGLVREALDQYCLAPDKVPVSLDDLKYAVEQRCSIKVRQKIVGFKAQYMRGCIEIWNTAATIYILIIPDIHPAMC